MSTNYYWTPPRGHRLAPFGKLHIGKTAGGWSFMFQAYVHTTSSSAFAPVAEGLLASVNTRNLWVSLKSWKDWRTLLKSGTIKDEYGSMVSFEHFCDIVERQFSPNSLFSGRPVLNHVTHLKTDPRYRDDSSCHDEARHWVDAQGYAFSVGNFS